MILSKQNLLIAGIAKNDKAIPVLGNIHITSDGTTIASDSKILIAVSPVTEEMKENIPLEEVGKKESCTIALDTVNEILKNLPKDTLFKGLLEHANLNKESKRFVIHDGKQTKTLGIKFYHRPYINFKKIFGSIGNKILRGKTSYSKRIVLNRKRLKDLLDVIDKVCPDTTGQSPIYLDFTEDNNILIRGVNYKTKQRVLALMSSYKGIEGKFLEPDIWEENLCRKKIAIPKRKK